MLNWRRERKSKVFFFVLQFSSFESLEIERNSVFPSIQALIRETDTHFEEPRMWRIVSNPRARNATYFAYFWICYFDSCHLRFQFMLHWSSSEIWVFEVHQTTVEKSKGNHVCCPTDIYAFYMIYTLFPNKETDK